MSTAVAVSCAGGVVLAGDRVVATGGHVRSRSQSHVFDFDDAGAAAVGAPGAVDGFAAQLDAAIRQYRTERGAIRIEPLSRLVADRAATFEVSALVTARDADGRPRLRAVDADGGTTDDDLAAFGSGATVALGALESGHDPDASLDDAASLARDALAVAAERDAGTGTDLDVYRLAAVA